MSQLALRVKVAFGLAFDVEKTASTHSGFSPAKIDLGAGKELFGDLRLDGFEAALRSGFAETLVLAGGDEGRYKNEAPVINRAETIRKILIEDRGISADRILAFPSRSNTGGNIAIFRAVMEDHKLDPGKCVLLTNLYHLPRALMDAATSGLAVQGVAAEALWLLQGEYKNELIARLGEGPLAERCAEEIKGIADKIRGTYTPRTDTTSMFDPKKFLLV